MGRHLAGQFGVGDVVGGFGDVSIFANDGCCLLKPGGGFFVLSHVAIVERQGEDRVAELFPVI